MREILNRISIKVVKYIFMIFVVLFFIANIFFTFERTTSGEYLAFYHFGISFKHIFYFILVCLPFIYILKSKKINNKIFLSIFLITISIVGFVWIFSNHQDLVALDDSYNTFRAAKLLVSNDYGPLGFKSYINTYPHNLTLVTYFMVFVKIFNEYALVAIRIANLAFVVIGYYSLYKICDFIFKDEKINSIMIYLMFLSMQFVFISFLVYGNAITYGISLLSVCLFIKFYKCERLKYLIISLLAIVVAASIKNNSLIILVAEIIILIIYMVNKKDYRILIGIIASISLFVFITKGTISFWENKAEIKYDNKLPTICWIAYGVNYNSNTPGQYFPEFQNKHHENDFNVKQTTENASIFIEAALSRFSEKPSVMFNFYWQKFLLSFANPEYEVLLDYRELPQSPFVSSVISGNLHRIIVNIWDVASTIISIGLLIFVVRGYKRVELIHMLGAIIVIGGFLFHLVWETKAIYTYQYFMYLLPYAAYGLANLRSENKCNT